MDWVKKHLQIVPINTFIDPIFPVENAIITHAHADHAKPGHKNVLATKHTIKIMKIDMVRIVQIIFKNYHLILH